MTYYGHIKNGALALDGDVQLPEGAAIKVVVLPSPEANDGAIPTLYEQLKPLIGMAAGGTGLIFFSLATLATVTGKDFSFMSKFLFIGLILLVVASLANIFFAIP